MVGLDGPQDIDNPFNNVSLGVSYSSIPGPVSVTIICWRHPSVDWWCFFLYSSSPGLGKGIPTFLGPSKSRLSSIRERWNSPPPFSPLLRWGGTLPPPLKIPACLGIFPWFILDPGTPPAP